MRRGILRSRVRRLHRADLLTPDFLGTISFHRHRFAVHLLAGPSSCRCPPTLTKRPQRLLEIDPLLSWADHIWMGVSVESAAYRSRIDLLRQTHAPVKFLSVEPLLGRIADMNLNGIDWVIVGGESGPRARPMQDTWGDRNPGPMRCRRCQVFLQAMGWGAQASHGAGVGWQDLGRNAA